MKLDSDIWTGILMILFTIVVLANGLLCSELSSPKEDVKIKIETTIND